jgi:RimJ/RimL family protein N-acetyltransferase
VNSRPVCRRDYRFLYNLLRQRDSTVNISHSKMPTWKEHETFLDCQPYPVHEIIIFGPRKIGMFYLTNKNEIGIFIDQYYQAEGFGRLALKMILERFKDRKLFANINPKNMRSQKLFASFDFKAIQVTYALNPKP